MKRVLILNGNGTGLESFAIRSVLEYFGYIVIMYNIGRPQDYFDIFSGKQNFNYDYLIIGCHGDDGKIIVPILGENVYYPNECRNNIGYEELRGLVKIKDKTVICTGCTTGAGELYKEFNRKRRRGYFNKRDQGRFDSSRVRFLGKTEKIAFRRRPSQLYQ